MDGILNVRKPKDWSSLDVVRVVRRSQRRAAGRPRGNADPAAEGVLPMCFGQATRLTDYLLDCPKSYRHGFAWGS